MAPTNIPTLTLGSPDKNVSYRTRTAVRCFVVQNNKICIIHINKGNCYRLPGGGLDPDDGGSHEIACRRESIEETGCDVELKSVAIAHCVEYRGIWQQDSYAYKCAVWEDTGELDLTEAEKEDGLTPHWFGLKEALEKMKDIEPTTELGKEIQKRDSFLLMEYIKTN